MGLTVGLARLVPVLIGDSMLARDGCDEFGVEVALEIEPELGPCLGD
jgi:hypothetical protein